MGEAEQPEEQEVPEGDEGADLLQQASSAQALEKAGGAAYRKIKEFVPLVGKSLYYKTLDGWYVYTTVRDVRWAFGRVDLLLEQGDKVGWASVKMCYFPPGHTRRMMLGVQKPDKAEDPGAAPLPDPEAPGGVDSGST